MRTLFYYVLSLHLEYLFTYLYMNIVYDGNLPYSQRTPIAIGLYPSWLAWVSKSWQD